MTDDEKVQRAMDHAWRYFELHAQQRMTVFNFYLAISGLIAAGVGVCLQQGTKFSVLASMLGLFLALITFIFWKLDQRVSEMIKTAESALIQVESATGTNEMKIFSRDPQALPAGTGSKIWTYGRCFRVSFLTTGIIGLAFAALPHFVDFSQKPSEEGSPYKRICVS